MIVYFFHHLKYLPEETQVSGLPIRSPQSIKRTSWMANCSSAVRLCLLLVVCCLFVQINAQKPISLPAALDSTIKNNLSINNERLKTEYAKALIKSAANIPQTQVTSEFGSFNSAAFDTKFGVSQSFALPAVYNKQKQLFTKEWESSLLNVTVKELELKKAVAEIFYNHRYLQEKEKLLLSIDSLYESLLKRANLRLQKGESNILEKTTFETQKNSIALQIAQVIQQRLMTEEIFNLLLNTNTRFVPSPSELKITDNELFNLTSIDEHPSLKMAAQQQQIAKANTDVERSKLLPEFIVGYNNMSIRGEGPGQVIYNSSDRFHSGQVGLGFPIFTSAQKARIKASRINEEITAKQYDVEKQQLQASYLANLAQYQQYRKMLEFYQNQYLKNIQTIRETANRQFLNGEINYLEFVMLLNQAITIQNGYIDLLSDYNRSVINLTYLNK